MVSASRIEEYRKQGRYIELAKTGDEDLGPLKLLPGTWKNTDAFAGRGWNMIALPFNEPNSPRNYRLLMNQFNEELKFSLVDKAVPNRGLHRNGGVTNVNQFIVTLDYEQMITQISAEDRPDSGLAGAANLAIHHEPGLWLHMTNETVDGIDIARLATVPHGDAARALGRSQVIDGPPTIPPVNGLPIGGPADLNHPYLAPYKHYDDAPFKGVITAAGFPGFNPISPHLLLAGGIPPNVKRTTILHVDTTVEGAGVANIPFIVRQANASNMVSTFWIMEMEKASPNDRAQIILMYMQVVLLDFFPRFDGAAGQIRWPHVSINVMEKVDEPTRERARMPSA